MGRKQKRPAHSRVGFRENERLAGRVCTKQAPDPKLQSLSQGVMGEHMERTPTLIPN